ncbi:MAG: hypothetical protein ACFE9I_18785 [Candidatus Hermodarchaeota archaeon]
MPSIDNLLELVCVASKGKDKIDEGAIGFNGYGFVFKNIDYKSKNSFITDIGSSKLCSFGVFKDVYRNFIKKKHEIESLELLFDSDLKLDLYFGGALKTLIPNLKFGGEEILFSVWIFVRTPKNQMFPIILYYGQSGTSIGGWSSDSHLSDERSSFSQKFKSIINFSTFNLSKMELDEFIEALTSALYKVQISDFEGLYEHDLGVDLMGIKSGVPFIQKFGVNSREEQTWSYAIMGSSEAFKLFHKFNEIIRVSLPLETYEAYPNGIPDTIYQNQIENHYEELISFADNQNSRLAYIILGVVLMSHRGKMTNELKKVILKYSDWKYEKNQLKSRRDKIERKRHLMEFRNKIKSYTGISQVKIPLYSLTRVINKRKAKMNRSPIYRKNIYYFLKK